MVVALVALFVALGGSAYAFTVPKDSVGTAQLKDSAVTNAKLHDSAVTSSKVAPHSLLANNFKAGQIAKGLGPAAGDLTGSYPNLMIASNTIISTMFAQGAVNSAAIGTDAVNTDALVDGAVTNSKLAGGAVGTSNFASGAQAPDSAQLGGLAANNWGAVMSGRINGLTSSVAWGAASGISSASGNEQAISTMSPDEDLWARDLSVQLTTSPGTGESRTFYVTVGGTPQSFSCTIPDLNTTCSHDGPPIEVPASSELSIEEGSSASPSSTNARFAFMLTPTQ
jgi:hypothetical protein